MINIRRNVFETNSSSMHSLVVVKNPKPYNKQELKFDIWDTERDFELFDHYDDEDRIYERSPYRVLRTPKDKLKYYVAYTLGNKEEYDKIPEIKNLIKKYTGLKFDQIILEHTSTRYDSRLRDDVETKDYGCVYGNDTGESPFEFIERKGITMEDLIMNPKYVIITDGDEYQLFKALFESNILNAEDFEDISSGADFWNDSVIEIYVNWFRPDAFRDYSDEDAVGKINQFTKKLVFLIDSDSRKYYNAERFKHIIEMAKDLNPDIKTALCHTRLNKKPVTLGNLNVSMFDEIDLGVE